MIDVWLEFNYGAPHTVNEHTILIDIWLEFNPGAPHTVNEPKIVLANHDN